MDKYEHEPPTCHATGLMDLHWRLLLRCKLANSATLVSAKLHHRWPTREQMLATQTYEECYEQGTAQTRMNNAHVREHEQRRRGNDRNRLR